MPVFAVKTFGCKLNQYETERMAQALSAAGYTRVGWRDEADMYLINSCTVTAKADRKTRAAARAVLRRRPNAKLVMTGCYVELEPVVFGEMDDRVTIVDMKGKADITEALGIAAPAPKALTAFETHTRLFLKVQDGCNRSCAYCRVVLARGPSVSRPLATVQEEVAAAIEGRVKEIVLTGVDMGSWREKARKLDYLLTELLKMPGDFRLRLSSIDPVDIDEPLIELLTSNPEKLCPHVHLPVQTGDDELAKRMARPSRRRHTIEVAEKLLVANPHYAIGADVMVGLPGEDEAAWENTVSLVKNIPFAYLHVFPFSPRPDTRAAEMPEQVGQHIVEKRVSQMLRMRKEKIGAFAESNRSTTRRVLVEEARDKETGYPIAITDNYIHVLLPGYDGPGNVFIDVKFDGEECIIKEDAQLLKNKDI
ncbi:MAG: tRNA (N(6)-L-threonylcarbamoyladenosine(37)-C(2))-methylthiotransferase MtaB [bacterium]|nr:tRNA (N(6)-L-threonylcarbamoyladenosine(37)-C(2))-methylthiotransferase MtaB [bacterium]